MMNIDWTYCKYIVLRKIRDIDWGLNTIITLGVLCFIMAIWSAIELVEVNEKCKDKGGLMLQTVRGYICVDLKTIDQIKIVE